MDTNNLRNIVAHQHPRVRTGSFRFPPQESPRGAPMPSLDDISMEEPNGYYSAGESKVSTPPRGTLLEILHRWRSPASVMSETKSVGEGDHGCDDNIDRHEDNQHGEGDEEGASNESMDDSDEPPTASVLARTRARSSTTGALPSEAAKRSRYLREGDRRTIIRRIDNGEKQAELAREFGVTRAAICHINKNRAEILGRSTRADVHAAARHPKRRMSKAALLGRQLQRQRQLSQNLNDQTRGEDHDQDRIIGYFASSSSAASADSASDFATVHVVQSLALTKHLTTLRRRETPIHDFRLVADRAFWLLIEEALACIPTRFSGHVATPTDSSDSDLEALPQVCAMVISEAGFPMLEAFRRIQPDCASGFVTFTRDQCGGYGESTPTLCRMSTPAGLCQRCVFVLDATCGDAREASLAIRSLVDVGVRARNVVFVALVISAAAVAELRQLFPELRIVAAAVDPEVSEDGEVRPGVGNFQQRYFRTTTIHQSGLGSTVEL